MMFLVTVETKLGTRYVVIPARTVKAADNFARDCAFTAATRAGVEKARATAVQVPAAKVRRPNAWSANLADVVIGGVP